jgi:hypothetical protein
VVSPSHLCLWDLGGICAANQRVSWQLSPQCLPVTSRLTVI